MLIEYPNYCQKYFSYVAHLLIFERNTLAQIRIWRVAILAAGQVHYLLSYPSILYFVRSPPNSIFFRRRHLDLAASLCPRWIACCSRERSSAKFSSVPSALKCFSPSTTCRNTCRFVMIKSLRRYYRKWSKRESHKNVDMEATVTF